MQRKEKTMKRTPRYLFTTLLALLICSAPFSKADAQPRKRQTTPQRRIGQGQTTVTAQTTKADPTKPQAVKEYKQGETYTLGDVVSLNAEGNRLVLEMEPKGASIEFKIKILGKPTSWSFTLGGKWDFTLVAGERTITPSEASQTDEVISTYTEPTLTTNFAVAGKDGGTIYFRDTTHPLLLRFDIPADLTKAIKKLELRNMLIGGDKEYALTFRLTAESKGQADDAKQILRSQ